MKKWLSILATGLGALLLIKFGLSVFSFFQKGLEDWKQVQAYKTYKAEKLTPPPDCENLDVFHFQIGENRFVLEKSIVDLFYRTEHETHVADMKKAPCVGTDENPIQLASISLNRFQKVNSARRSGGILSEIPEGITFLRLREATPRMKESLNLYGHLNRQYCGESNLNYCRLGRLVNELDIQYHINISFKQYKHPKNEYQARRAYVTNEEQDEVLLATRQFITNLISVE